MDMDLATVGIALSTITVAPSIVFGTAGVVMGQIGQKFSDGQDAVKTLSTGMTLAGSALVVATLATFGTNAFHASDHAPATIERDVRDMQISSFDTQKPFVAKSTKPVLQEKGTLAYKISDNKGIARA